MKLSDHPFFDPRNSELLQAFKKVTGQSLTEAEVQQIQNDIETHPEAQKELGAALAGANKELHTVNDLIDAANEVVKHLPGIAKKGGIRNKALGTLGGVALLALVGCQGKGADVPLAMGNYTPATAAAIPLDSTKKIETLETALSAVRDELEGVQKELKEQGNTTKLIAGTVETQNKTITNLTSGQNALGQKLAATEKRVIAGEDFDREQGSKIDTLAAMQDAANANLAATNTQFQEQFTGVQQQVTAAQETAESSAATAQTALNTVDSLERTTAVQLSGVEQNLENMFQKLDRTSRVTYAVQEELTNESGRFFADKYGGLGDISLYAREGLKAVTVKLSDPNIQELRAYHFAGNQGYLIEGRKMDDGSFILEFPFEANTNQGYPSYHFSFGAATDVVFANLPPDQNIANVKFTITGLDYNDGTHDNYYFENIAKLKRNPYR